MRKLTLLVILVSLSAITKAQKSVLFKFKYLPKHTYGITTKTDIDVQIALPEGNANLEKNIDTATTNLNMKISNELSASIKTNEIKEKNLQVTILGHSFSSKATLNGVEPPNSGTNPVSGLTVNGEIDTEGKLSVDTAEATNEIKSATRLITNEMPKQAKFLDKQISIGDTFTQVGNLNALDLPNFGIDIDYPIKTTYKFIAVKDSLAYFDTTSEYDLNISKETQGKTANISGKGNGAGKMIFNIVKGYPQSEVNNIDYVLEMEVPTMKVAIKFSINTDERFTVTSN